MEPVENGSAADWMELTRRVAAMDQQLRDERMSVEALQGEVARLRVNIQRLLDQVGDRRPCKGADCAAIIWYVRLKSGKIAPYTADALNHFADCPDARRFRGGKE